MKYTLRGRIWVDGDQGILIGKGRAALLEKIHAFGSISEAAKSMKMSYRQAWGHIDSMNKQSKKPVVIKVSGGSGGGGSMVTKEGLRLLALYHKLTQQFEMFCEKETKKMN